MLNRCNSRGIVIQMRNASTMNDLQTVEPTGQD
jgi:hypothetical protein